MAVAAAIRNVERTGNRNGGTLSNYMRKHEIKGLRELDVDMVEPCLLCYEPLAFYEATSQTKGDKNVSLVNLLAYAFKCHVIYICHKWEDVDLESGVYMASWHPDREVEQMELEWRSWDDVTEWRERLLENHLASGNCSADINKKKLFQSLGMVTVVTEKMIDAARQRELTRRKNLQ